MACKMQKNGDGRMGGYALASVAGVAAAQGARPGGGDGCVGAGVWAAETEASPPRAFTTGPAPGIKA